MSTTARDQPRVALLTTVISPFGMTCIRPSKIAEHDDPKRHLLDHAALPGGLDHVADGELVLGQDEEARDRRP